MGKNKVLYFYSQKIVTGDKNTDPVASRRKALQILVEAIINKQTSTKATESKKPVN